VNATGAWAQPLAAMIGIDLPVRAAKRVTYVVDCPDGFTDPVLLFDTAQNIYLRPESSKQYIVAEHPEEVVFVLLDNS
jgi:glycine/D-amino acid oxidase-like deaminating enzyme